MNEGTSGRKMIRERIMRDRKRRSATRRGRQLKTLVSLVGVLIVVGVGLYRLDLLTGFVERRLDPAQSKPEPIAQERAPEKAEPSSTAPAAPVAATPAPSPPPAAATTNETDPQALLRRIEQLPVAAGPGATPAEQAAHERISLQREKALEAWHENDPDSALRLVTGAERDVEEVRRQREERYQLNLRAAQEAHDRSEPATARAHVEKALELKPEAPEALELSQQIELLSLLAAARERADAARRNGDLEAEAKALGEILSLDPQDAAARQRATEIVTLVQEQAFQETLARGRQAVAEGALAPARQALAEAQQQRPNDAGVQELRGQIAGLERDLARDRHVSDAERAAGADDWEAALKEFDKALALDPAHHEAGRGHDLATRVTTAQKKIDDLLAQPERLGSPNVAAAAGELENETAALDALSPRLRTSRAALARAIDMAGKPVPVRVLSDDQTEIGIRGVGQIGRTRERTIELLPGTYVFEGKRQGYRSRLVRVTVPVGGAGAAAPIEVRVVSDERS